LKPSVSISIAIDVPTIAVLVRTHRDLKLLKSWSKLLFAKPVILTFTRALIEMILEVNIIIPKVKDVEL